MSWYCDLEPDFWRHFKLMENELSDYELGFAALEVEDYQAALRYLISASEAAGSDPDIMYAVAYCYISLSRYADSVPILKRALKLRPDFLVARAALGDVYTAPGDYRAATSLNLQKRYDEAAGVTDVTAYLNMLIEGTLPVHSLH
jgi:tetratricopeptide (TPR) repeat protein